MKKVRKLGEKSQVGQIEVLMGMVLIFAFVVFILVGANKHFRQPKTSDIAHPPFTLEQCDNMLGRAYSTIQRNGRDNWANMAAACYLSYLAHGMEIGGR